ncbi:hypothetical protein EV702DRAFT_418927 [Suillus placidus]|uniref:Uncharacterized protein n=1 Tax=Suillus placidus TaxID=48579 RepID=A0A9P6ZFB5_9AGAM|nr:hypothetical protein EV702DRAFT_418927 [Suillus placidus]
MSIAPAREIQEPAQFYFKLNMSDVDLVRHLKDHYDQEEYGLSVISFRRMRNSWGWKQTRVLQVTESIMISGVLLVTSIQQPSALSSCLSILNMSMFSSMMYPRSAPLGLGKFFYLSICIYIFSCRLPLQLPSRSE